MDKPMLAKLTAAHAAFPTLLRALVQGLPPDLLTTREAPKRWSPLEVLVHLRDEEILDFRPRAAAAASGQVIETAIDPERWVVERRYNEEDPAVVLSSFAAERAASCARLLGLDDAALKRTPLHARLGAMTAADFIAAWRMHDLLHLRQLTTAIARLTAKGLEGHRIEYAGEAPWLAV